MTEKNIESRGNRKISILDIPPWWGDTPEKFKEQVIRIIKQNEFWPNAPRYDTANPDGSISSFYPILCAVSPEWGIITEEEILSILRTEYAEQAFIAYRAATKKPADHIWGTVYLAWGLEQWLFSLDQIQKIRFDHGDTPESYIREYGESWFIEKAVRNLIHPYCRIPEIKEQTSGQIDDCLCCH